MGGNMESPNHMNDFKAIHKVVIIVIFLVIVGGLQLSGHETAAFTGLGLLILGAIGLTIGTVQGIRDNTNGSANKMLEAFTKQAEAIQRFSEKQVEIMNAQQNVFNNILMRLPPIDTTENVGAITIPFGSTEDGSHETKSVL